MAEEAAKRKGNECAAFAPGGKRSGCAQRVKVKPCGRPSADLDALCAAGCLRRSQGLPEGLNRSAVAERLARSGVQCELDGIEFLL